MNRKTLGFALAFGFALAASAGVAFAQEHEDHAQEHAPEHRPSAPATAAPTTGVPHGAATPAHGEATHGEHAAAHGEHAGHHGPAAINWTDVSNSHQPAYLALVINFGVLLLGYYLIGKKPVADALKQRRVTIGKAIDDAQAMLAEAKDRAKKYQADLKNVDADAADAKAALVAAGKGEVERMLAEANEKSARMKRDADRLIEQERKQLQHDLLMETIERSVAEATRTLEKSVSAEDHARLAEDLLAELSAKPAAAAAREAGGVS
jgi:F-type H+-transporting ATPase subunit b